MDEPINVSPPVPPRAKPPPFFQKTDWQAFGLTALVTFIVYLFSLAPEVNLEFSGVYATDAMYPGPSIPPGHPLMAIYGWLAIKLIPFGNIAWRLGLASAFAGCLACGSIAFLVSRIGVIAVGDSPEFKTFSAFEQTAIRLVCGLVAGLGLGLDSSFWPKAVVGDPWPLSILLFSLTLCLLTRWFFLPAQKLPLYLSFLTASWTVVESQALIPAVFSLLILAALGDRKFGRDALLLVAILLWWANETWWGRNISYQWFGYGSSWLVFSTALMITLIVGVLCLITRRVFTEWKSILLLIVIFSFGLSAYLLVAVFSMTTPPINWGYPRLVEGFFHTYSRGQYGCGTGALDPPALATDWEIYLKITSSHFGLIYLFFAVIPVVFAWKVRALARRWCIAIYAAWFLMTCIMVVVLDLTWDRSTMDADAPYFAITHLMLALVGGLGLVLTATYIAHRHIPKSEPLPNI